jgi:DNA polymerase III sliding clamp (beta) subunit (PCNA family)
LSDPFTLLPANLGGLAAVTADEGSRFTMTGVLVKVGDGGYEAVATDGRRLAAVKGRPEADPLEYPTVPDLAEAPPSAPQAVIPARAWKGAFKSAPRGNQVAEQPILGHVAVHLGAQESILATTDGADASVSRVANLECRFPDYERVIPTDEPQSRVTVNADYLAELLKLARQFGPADGPNRVVLELRGPQTPIVLRTANGSQQFLGLVMPIVGRDP